MEGVCGVVGTAASASDSIIPDALCKDREPAQAEHGPSYGVRRLQNRAVCMENDVKAVQGG